MAAEAAEAAAGLPFAFTLTPRAENHAGSEDAGSHPGRLRRGLEAPHVLALGNLSVDEIADAGAQRISVGGSLTWTAVEAMAAAAGRIRDDGDFSSLAGPTRIRDWLAG